MGDQQLEQQILLAVLGLVVGVGATLVERLLTKERRRVTYSCSTTPILAGGASLPEAVRAALPDHGDADILRFVVRAQNTGKVAVHNLGLLLVPSEETVLLEHEVQTSPAHGVPHRGGTEHGNRVRCSNVALAPGQGMEVSLYLRSACDPAVRPYWSSQDTVFQQGRPRRANDVDQHLIGLVHSAIGVLVAPALVVGLYRVVMSTLEAVGLAQVAGTEGWQAVLGALVRLYFLLRGVPCASALVRDLREGRHRCGAPREAVIDLRAQTVAGFEDVERRRRAQDRRQT